MTVHAIHVAAPEIGVVEVVTIFLHLLQYALCGAIPNCVGSFSGRGSFCTGTRMEQTHYKLV